jgi:hypothetical protein
MLFSNELKYKFQSYLRSCWCLLLILLICCPCEREGNNIHWLWIKVLISASWYQLLAHGRWFSQDTPDSSTTKTGRHDIAEILLKVALNTMNQIKSNQINKLVANTSRGEHVNHYTTDQVNMYLAIHQCPENILHLNSKNIIYFNMFIRGPLFQWV